MPFHRGFIIGGLWTTSTATEYQYTCNNRESRIRTDYQRTGNTVYSTYSSWVSSPDCNSGCFTTSSAAVYSGSCNNRTTATRTTYTANAGSGCTTYYTDGPYTSSPDCNSGCFDSADSTSTVYDSGTCGNRQSATRTTTTYTAKAGSGCTTYSTFTDGAYTASPNCTAGCFDSSTGTSTVYSGSCAARTSVTRTTTTYTAKTGTNCTTYSTYTDSTPAVAAPDCTGACRTAKTGNFSQGGRDYVYTGPAGSYYSFPNPECSSGCDFSTAYYSVTTCGGTNYITLTSSDGCYNVFGDPC